MGKRVLSTATGVLALLLLGAMGAWACTNLATLNLGSSQVPAGSSIDVTGSSFSEVGDEIRPVELRWNATDGPLLAEVEPDSDGTFSTTVEVPEDAEAGHYVLVANQLAAEPGHGLEADEEAFSPVFGTPARASVMVGSPAAAEAIEADVAPAGVSADGGTGGLMALSATLALLAVGLFGAALALFTRELRSRKRAAPVSSPVGRSDNP